MNTPSTLTTTICTVLFMATQTTRADIATSSHTIWNEGCTYETIVMMTIDVSNATLVASSEYHGAYKLPHLAFTPVLRMVTSGICKQGMNYYGKRVYRLCQQRTKDIGKIKWKSNRKKIDPRRIVESIMMNRVKEVKDWNRDCKKLIQQMEGNGDVVEEFKVFYDDEHNPVPFDLENEALLLQWSDSSVDNYVKGKTDDLIAKVYLGGINDTSRMLANDGPFKVAPFEIRRTIVAECNVLADILYDDPSGRRRLGLKNQREWWLDAGNINKGLLSYGNMTNLVNFSGSLKVHRDTIEPSDYESKNLSPFKGDKLIVIDTRGAKFGYNVGERFKPFRLNISYDRRDDPNANRMEFWFDAKHSVLRYARVRIVNDKYDGDLPNPKLGKATSALKGTVKGRVAFELELITAIDQPLPTLSDEAR